MEALEQTYAYLEAYHTAHGIPPTHKEICEALYISQGTGYLWLKKLEKLGWIKRYKYRQRSVVLLGME